MNRFRAAELLMRPHDPGYPDDYLRSRLRGRRSRLIADWGPLMASAAPLAQALDEEYRRIFRDISSSGAGVSLALEYRWVYRQMNTRMRETCGPFFLYSELRTLFICLRHLREGQPGRMRDVLAASLLSERIKKALFEAADAAGAVRRTEDIFLSLSPDFGGVAGVYERAGLVAFEKVFVERYFSAALGSALHPAVRQVFGKLIDSRNIISAYKWLSLGPDAAFEPIRGGDIPPERLDYIVRRGDRDGLVSLLREFMHPARSGNLFGNPEPALYRGITFHLRRKGRDPSGIWSVLQYLWQISVEAMNLNLLAQGRELPREMLSGELVR